MFVGAAVKKLWMFLIFDVSHEKLLPIKTAFLLSRSSHTALSQSFLREVSNFQRLDDKMVSYASGGY